jgi:hypothetical protein
MSDLPPLSRSPERSSKHRHKHRRDRSPSNSSDTDSEEEERRRRRKERKRAKRGTDHGRSKRKRTRSPPPSASDDESQWIEKTPASSFIPEVLGNTSNATTLASSHDTAVDDESDDDGVGPRPAFKAITLSNGKKDERQYGGALLRGEGSAMAAFLQDGTDSRIPRRGEIGLTSDEIAQYETAGYVMSGSRHRVMNAVRMRKENQVISAEEKRGILKLQQEERERREMVLREEFQELLKEKIKGTEVARRA